MPEDVHDDLHARATQVPDRLESLGAGEDAHSVAAYPLGLDQLVEELPQVLALK